MTRDEILNARDDVLAIVVAQGEKRLDGQCTFAEVQDARGGALISASVTLAAAALAVAVAAAEFAEARGPISLGSIVATLGFSLSAWLALWSTRACNFHHAGWYPNDFAADIADGRTSRDIAIDFALDLQHRLSENRRALIRRGDLYNRATWVLLGTPLVALLIAFIAS